MPKILRTSTVPQSLDTFCNGLLKKMAAHYEVVALSSAGEALARIEMREGVRTIALDMERRISPWRDLKSLWALIKVLRKERPTMVHSITPKAGLLSMMAAWITRVPLRVHTFTGLVFPTASGMQRQILILTDWLTCACATHIIPEGEGVKHDLERYRITRKPLQVLGYGNVRGVDMDYYQRTPSVVAQAETIRMSYPDRFIFLFVGRIVRDKGINELVEAFAQLNAQYPQTQLLLVGPYEDALDPISPEAKTTITEHPQIDAVGAKRGDDLLAYYAAADCFVFPSYREGFPNTVLEAGAMELPALVTDINGSREIIEEGVSGTIVPSKAVQPLLQGMKRLYLDPALGRQMGCKARERVAARFETHFVQQQQLDFYRAILEKR